MVSVLVFLNLISLLSVANPIPGLFNTGVDNFGVLLPDGAVDSHYQIVEFGSVLSSNSSFAFRYTTFPAWQTDGPLSRWISVSGISASGPTGNYIYRTTFNLTGFDPATASLSGFWYADDAGSNIILNGLSTGIVNNNPSAYVELTNFSISSGFIIGQNILDFVIINTGGATGFRFEIVNSTIETNASAPSPTSSPITLLPTPSPTSLPTSVVCGNGVLEYIEQCDDGNLISGDGCTMDCAIEYGWSCSVLTSPSKCDFCYGNWIPVSIGISPLCSDCQNGTIALVRRVSQRICSNNLTYSNSNCSFPCLAPINQTSDNILSALNNTYLQQLFSTLEISSYYSSFTVFSFDYSTIGIVFTPCKASLNMSYVKLIVNTLLSTAFPGLSPSVTEDDSICTLYIQKARLSDINKYLPLLSLLILLALPLYLVYSYRSSVIHELPKEISWSFLDKLTHPWRWTNTLGYYTREYEKDSIEWKRVHNLLSDNLYPLKIFAIYNPTLTVSFVNQWKIFTTRFRTSPGVFFSKNYTRDVQKMWVMDQFANLCSRFSWNEKLDIPLIPSFHGTDFYIAEKIAQTGFAVLSSLDAGYFGKGIYFTTVLSYTLPYAYTKQNPAVIVSYVNLGNIYPVTEDHRGPLKLLGASLKQGYNSHFIVTTKKGDVYNQELDYVSTQCTEIVVGQESQILPAFIVVLDAETCQAQFLEWNRETPTPLDAVAYRNISSSKVSAQEHSSVNVSYSSKTKYEVV